MSISPTDAQRPVRHTSPCDSEQNPRSGHGLLPPMPDSGSLGPRVDGPESIPGGSKQDSVLEPPSSWSGEMSGRTPGSVQDTSSASKKAGELKVSNARKHLSGQISSTYPQNQLSGQGRSSQFRSNKLGPQPNGRLAAADMSVSDHWPLGSSDSQLTATQAASRRSQYMNANHLLNFHYDPVPRARPQQRNFPPRRQQRIKPYNKDLFLQANYKFVIFDSGNYSIESIDPDKMFPWEDVVCVRCSTPYPVQCPICLESPLCPQITTCGHIYCFPCILRYLLMGMEDHKGESWKKCPLCFTMISSKDLYTIKIENVKLFHVGDHANFALLARPKDSLIPLLKIQDGEGLKPNCADNTFDLYSKFIFTPDIQLSVRDAKTSLSDWLCKAEADIVGDLEKLPYVCAALEQLEERIKKWMENRAINGSPQVNPCPILCSPKVMHNAHLSSSCSVNLTSEMEYAHSDTWMNRTLDNCLKHEKPEVSQRTGVSYTEMPAGSSELLYNEEKWPQKDSNISKESRGRETYTFYQAIDGQPLILHPLNMKCLLHHYGSYDMLPSRISGEILELETITQSEAVRKRYRYLSHFSLTTTFQLCEIDLTEILPPSSLALFLDEIKKREKQRKRHMKKECDEKARADAAICAEVAALRETLNPTNQRYLTNDDTIFSLDEFEALGSGAAPSTSPPMNTDRKLFSNVTRLGFAASHDSLVPRGQDSTKSSGSTNATHEVLGAQGPRPAAMLSFANVLSSNKSQGSSEKQKSNVIAKKGKKPTKVLLSTAGGRRY